MNPENQQTPPVQPIQLQPTPVPEFQPAAQSTAFPQPATTSITPISGMTPPTSANLEKQKKLALILAIASIVIFIVGLIVGYVLAIAAFLGAYALVIGIRTKSVPTIILGTIGLVLNLGLYVLSMFVK